jgi:hypothetical protein
VWQAALGLASRRMIMRVYLDNNVLVDVEQGKLKEEFFLSRPNTEYYYSDAHLGELLEARGNTKVSQKDRLKLISRICGQNCILSGVLDEPEFIQKDVLEMYRIADTPLRSAINAMAKSGTNIFEKVRVELGFEGRQFNNEPPEKVLSVIDERMKEKLGIGLIPYLLSSEAFGGKVLYYTLLNMIDTANYWGDTKTDYSEVARLHDAFHAYSAIICDALVTSDKRMMAKVKAIYFFLGVKTKVLSAKDYLSGGKA